jgi:hypothetical protein
VRISIYHSETTQFDRLPHEMDPTQRRSLDGVRDALHGRCDAFYVVEMVRRGLRSCAG